MFAAEDWAGVSVRIQQCKILGSESEAALLVMEVFDPVSEKDELGSMHRWPLRACEGEQAEFHTAIDSREESRAILEVVQACQ